MWELTKRISLRTSAVLSKVEPDPDLYTTPAPTKKYRLRNTGQNYLYALSLRVEVFVGHIISYWVIGTYSTYYAMHESLNMV